MLKILGIFFAVSASTAAGLYKGMELRKRRQLLLDFQDLLLQLSTEIGYFREPLPKIFERLEGVNKESKMLMKVCLNDYYNTNENLAEIWKNACAKVYAKTPLTSDDLAIISKCGDFLGQSDLKGQQEHIHLIRNQLERQIKEADEEARRKGTMYAKFGLSFGLIIAVVLI